MFKKRKFSEIYFGWWTVLASGLLSLWGHGFNAYGISALFKPIASELGFNRTLTSVAASIGRFEGGFDAPIAGWITDKYGPKWIILFGVSLISLALMSMYFINSLWSFYLVWGVLLGTGINTALALPIMVGISNWFVKKRGVALSIQTVFSGISGALILPLIAWLISVVGWRSTCMIGGLVMGFVGIPLVLICFKSHRPEYYGLLPDGADINNGSPEMQDVQINGVTNAVNDRDSMIDRGKEYAAEVSEVEFTLMQAWKTSTYWLLICVQAIYGLVAPAINIHCIAFLTDRGISPIIAAGMQAIMITSSIPARFVGGFIGDRLSKETFRYLVAGAYSLQAIGIGIYIWNQTVMSIYVWFILYGIGMGASMTLNTLMRARYFGRKSLGKIGGTSAMFLTPVGIAAPIYAGWIYDTTKSYLTAFILFTVLLAMAAAILPFVKPPKPPVTSDAAIQ